MMVMVRRMKDVMLYQEDDQLLWLMIAKTDSERCDHIVEHTCTVFIFYYWTLPPRILQKVVISPVATVPQVLRLYMIECYIHHQTPTKAHCFHTRLSNGMLLLVLMLPLGQVCYRKG